MKKLLLICTTILLFGIGCQSKQDCAWLIDNQVVTKVNDGILPAQLFETEGMLETENGQCLAFLKTSTTENGITLSLIYDGTKNSVMFFSVSGISEKECTKENHCLPPDQFKEEVQRLFTNPHQVILSPNRMSAPEQLVPIKN